MSDNKTHDYTVTLKDGKSYKFGGTSHIDAGDHYTRFFDREGMTGAFPTANVSSVIRGGVFR